MVSLGREGPSGPDENWPYSDSHFMDRDWPALLGLPDEDPDGPEYPEKARMVMEVVCRLFTVRTLLRINEDVQAGTGRYWKNKNLPREKGGLVFLLFQKFNRDPGRAVFFRHLTETVREAIISLRAFPV